MTALLPGIFEGKWEAFCATCREKLLTNADYGTACFMLRLHNEVWNHGVMLANLSADSRIFLFSSRAFSPPELRPSAAESDEGA